MSSVIYFDTSALAKWYINECNSEEVESYLRENGHKRLLEGGHDRKF